MDIFKKNTENTAQLYKYELKVDFRNGLVND